MASNILELYLEKIAELIKDYPNDQELGKAVRKLYEQEEYLKKFKQ